MFPFTKSTTVRNMRFMATRHLILREKKEKNGREKEKMIRAPLVSVYAIGIPCRDVKSILYTLRVRVKHHTAQSVTTTCCAQHGCCKNQGKHGTKNDVLLCSAFCLSAIAVPSVSQPCKRLNVRRPTSYCHPPASCSSSMTRLIGRNGSTENVAFKQLAVPKLK